MKLKEVSVTYSRTVSPKPYHSQKVEIQLWAELENGDSEIEAVDGLRQMARNHVMAELARSNPSLKEQTDKLPMGTKIDPKKSPFDLPKTFVPEAPHSSDR